MSHRNHGKKRPHQQKFPQMQKVPAKFFFWLLVRRSECAPGWISSVLNELMPKVSEPPEQEQETDMMMEWASRLREEQVHVLVSSAAGLWP
jgi:hypothetical protein